MSEELEMLERWIGWLEADEKNGDAPVYVTAIAEYLRKRGHEIYRESQSNQWIAVPPEPTEEMLTCRS